MNKMLFAAFAAVSLLFTSFTPAVAANDKKPVKVELRSSPVMNELNMTSGKATIVYHRGTVRLTVKKFPHVAGTRDCLPMTLSDRTTHPMTQETALRYEGWLLKVGTNADGRFVIEDGMSLGDIEVSRGGSGKIFYKGGEAIDRSYNTVVVTAEDIQERAAWEPGDEFYQSFTWGGSSNGAIILWGFAEVPGTN